MTAHEELETAKREAAKIVDTLFAAKCSDAELAKCEQACVALMASLAPNFPDLREWVHDLFEERRAERRARKSVS